MPYDSEKFLQKKIIESIVDKLEEKGTITSTEAKDLKEGKIV